MGEQWWGGLPREDRDVTNSFRRATSARSCSKSGGALMAETDGGDTDSTSIILSVSWARSSTDIASLVEASTIRTFVGRHCKNSSQRKAPSVAAAYLRVTLACARVIALVYDHPALLRGITAVVCIPVCRLCA